jgi:hypothetical protein
MSDWITKENADVVVAWATIGAALVGLLAALAAVRQLRMIQQDSRERTRPYVQLDVVPGLQGPGSWDLVVENRGASTALEVVIDAGEFTPLDAKDHIAPVIGRYLLTPKTLVPGARRRVMWGYQLRRDVTHSDGSKESVLVREAGVLTPREATVTYTDQRKARSWWGRKRSYMETFLLNGAADGAVIPAPTEGPIPGSTDMLQHIDKALRTMNSHLGELRR